MQRLGSNHGAYRGETIDIRTVLSDIEVAARQCGWNRCLFHRTAEFKWHAFHRPAGSPATSRSSFRVYISTGIHGDEPAGPLAALRLLRENRWPEHLDLWLCPCLNPTGFALNRRANDQGLDLNRDYRHFKSAEVQAHVNWLADQPDFTLTLCLHEDWESRGFYVYELNPEQKPWRVSVRLICPR